jgi:phosphopantothenoylcysteine synthetase/decarboxylase
VKILIASGATREPVDAVRFLSNTSTGRTGALLADFWAERRHTISFLSGEGGALPRQVTDVETFSSAEDLRARLERRLAPGGWDAVVMVAGVSDYRPESPPADKISSEAPALTLRLLRNPKIIPLLKSYSPRPVFVVGFKLTAGADQAARRAAVAAQFATGGVDLVVQNDVEEIAAATRHPFYLYTSAEKPVMHAEGAEELAEGLEALILAGINR